MTDTLTDAWQRWWLWQTEDNAVQAMSQLDRHMLNDIGVSHEVRSRAEALQAARLERLDRIL